MKTRKRNKRTSSLDAPKNTTSEQSSRPDSLSLSMSAMDKVPHTTHLKKGKKIRLVPRVYLDIIKLNSQSLLVTVKAARHLYDGNGTGVDSYVRVHITGQPPEADWVTYTRINDANPVYNEPFNIDILETLLLAHLQVSIWSVNKDKSHQCMGCMSFPFHMINVMNKRLLGWFELLDTTLGQTDYRPFVTLDCRISQSSEVGHFAEMQLTSNTETLEIPRRKAVIELVNYTRRYLISIVNKYKIYCKSLKSYLSLSHYNALFNKLELVIQTQINMFDYIKHCYNGRYALGSVLRSWIPELVCVIEYQRHKDHCLRMLQDLEQSECPDVIDIIKDKLKEYSALFSMPLTYIKNLARFIRNVLHYTLEKHPDYANMTWVKQYVYWLEVQVESPQRISHNQTFNHSIQVIDRSFTFSMPDYHEDDFVEYDWEDLGEISSLPDSPDYSDPPSEQEHEETPDMMVAEGISHSAVSQEGMPVVVEEEEGDVEFEWPVVPPDELEIDDEVLLTNQRTASLAKTLDQVIEVFSSVSKKKTTGALPLPDSSNWKTIQKLVLPSDQLEDGGSTCEDKLIPSDCSDEEGLDEDEEGLHISINQTEPYYYQTNPECIADKRPSKESLNDSAVGSIIEFDVDEVPAIIPLDHSPKGHHTFSYNHLKSSNSGKSSPSSKRSNDSINNQRSQLNSRSDLENSLVVNGANNLLTPLNSRRLGSQKRSKSTVVRGGTSHHTPDLSIRRIYAVKSLNDIVFSEDEYDFAAV
ncbi:uncharacterized protein LOC134826621 isoform X2 [Bolinopsis microptera]|uniref:uncharacterized protein LOC134826621 isoform X2 n=1 Tax=Bolinopsis microptera TaxID=2820187 RepID=UPI003078AD97